MAQIFQKNQELESNKITINLADQTETETSITYISVSDLIATLKNIKVEEQELLIQRKELQATESDLRNQVISEIDEKKKIVAGLKSQLAFLQNKCNELEQALDISVCK